MKRSDILRAAWAILLSATLASAQVSSRAPAAASEEALAARVAALESLPREQPDALRGPVDPDVYVVGPGDRFAVTVSLQDAPPLRGAVGPEGTLVLPGFEAVALAGNTLSEAKSRIRKAVAARYRNVDIEVALIGLRRIEVHVVGQVGRPGTYVGTALDPAGKLIDEAGGLREGASRRNIVITRRNGETSAVDLTRYAVLGDLEANPPIVDGDVIRVPFIKEQVQVDGAVETQGSIELVPGDTVGLLLELAGGLARGAQRDTVELRRYQSDHDIRRISVALDANGGSEEPVRDGDQVYVRATPEYRPPRSVVVEGAVQFSGPYGIDEGIDRLSDVIARAGGFTAGASLAEAQLVRAPHADETDLEFERLKQIPVQDMSGTEYAYFKSKARQRKGLMVVDFERLAAGDESEDRLLRDGDRIIVPERRETITVSGSVVFPGLITYVEGKKPGYYVEQAGGWASNADRGGARVIRGVTGEWEEFGRSGMIVPGDEVWIPEKPERDWWQLAQDAVRFAASIATVYLVIDQATRD